MNNTKMQNKFKIILICLLLISLVTFYFFKNKSNDFKEVDSGLYDKHGRMVINHLEAFKSYNKEGHWLYNEEFKDYENLVCENVKLIPLCNSGVDFISIQVLKDSIIVYEMNNFNRPFDGGYTHYLYFDPNQKINDHFSARDSTYNNIKKLSDTLYYIIQRSKEWNE